MSPCVRFAHLVDMTGRLRKKRGRVGLKEWRICRHSFNPTLPSLKICCRHVDWSEAEWRHPMLIVNRNRYFVVWCYRLYLAATKVVLLRGN
ncbi:MAG: hypothetical protein LBU22_13170 [Dysgonamonadaceae bacterium]|jgi:hypothetical protein|nr:hypothetical protein [Dysgonamonadaceae bacterium]